MPGIFDLFYFFLQFYRLRHLYAVLLFNFFLSETKYDTGTAIGYNELAVAKFFHFSDQCRGRQHITMYHVAGILFTDRIYIDRPVKVFVIIFILIKRGKTGHFLPFLADGENAQADILAFTGQCEGIEILRLAELFCKDDFVHPAKILN